MSAAYSSASARGDRSPVAGSSTICRISAPASVSPGSNVLHDLVAERGQPAAEQFDLGGLADPVAALEDDEEAGFLR